MRLLYRLASAGFSIWPFDPVAWPRIVEIYPRALTGAVIKSRPEARAAFLRDRAVELDAPLLEKAVSSEDAFDAVVSALEMALHVEELEALEPVSDPRLVLEGVIWLPRRARIPAGGRSTAGDASNRPRPRGLPRPEPLAGATSALDASARGVHGGGAPRTSQSHPSRSH
jgi:hypothetical protein